MRLLPLFPVVLLLVGALLSSGDSWASLGDDEVTVDDAEKDSAQTREQLETAQQDIMAEIRALEEGYSDLEALAGKNEKEQEALLIARLNDLQERLARIQQELRKLPKKKRGK
jgi:uncharacterized protein with gpF-like domain